MGPSVILLHGAGVRVAFGDDVAEELTTWSTVQKSRLESPVVFASLADMGEVDGRGRREQLLRAGRGPFVVDILSLHLFGPSGDRHLAGIAHHVVGRGRPLFM